MAVARRGDVERTHARGERNTQVSVFDGEVNEREREREAPTRQFCAVFRARMHAIAGVDSRARR